MVHEVEPVALRVTVMPTRSPARTGGEPKAMTSLVAVRQLPVADAGASDSGCVSLPFSARTSG